MKPLSLASHYLRHKLKICEFAITNICTAQCDFCSIWRQKEKVTIDLDMSLRVIDHLSRLGVKFITFTGGEPMLHPHFDTMIERSTRRNIYSAILNADARLFNEKRLDALHKSRVDVVCISIDHHTDEIMSASRKIPHLLFHIEKAVGELRKRRIKSLASILICTFNHQTLRELFGKCAEIGFDMISINYPVFSESPVYTLGGEAIDLSKEEVVRALESVLALKSQFKNIVNPVASLKNIIAFLRGQTPEFPCRGGSKAFFIDWYFNAHPCMFLKENMGPALRLTEKDCRRPACNLCSMSWYRDFSLYFQGWRSIKLLLSSLPAVIRGKS
jgi:MoaA/NifB/PqqE/SkfB family radical SAM enzyme